VKRLVGLLRVYFTALSAYICITLLFTPGGRWLRPGVFGSSFCSSNMIKMAFSTFINAQFDAHRQTDASWLCDLYAYANVVFTWQKVRPVGHLKRCLDLNIVPPKVLCCLLTNQSLLPSILVDGRDVYSMSIMYPDLAYLSKPPTQMPSS